MDNHFIKVKILGRISVVHVSQDFKFKSIYEIRNQIEYNIRSDLVILTFGHYDGTIFKSQCI